MGENERVWVDAIALKREGAARVHEETKGMSLEEELAYWDRKSGELAARIAAMKASEGSEASTEDKVAS